MYEYTYSAAAVKMSAMMIMKIITRDQGGVGVGEFTLKRNQFMKFVEVEEDPTVEREVQIVE